MLISKLNSSDAQDRFGIRMEKSDSHHPFLVLTIYHDVTRSKIGTLSNRTRSRRRGNLHEDSHSNRIEAD